jgi:hypothetical protein
VKGIVGAINFIYAVTKTGTVFNWGAILSAALEQAISAAKHTAPGMHLAFYMASYLLDTVCVINAFPGMGWQWQSSDPPIHICCQDLWEHK